MARGALQRYADGGATLPAYSDLTDPTAGLDYGYDLPGAEGALSGSESPESIQGLYDFGKGLAGDPEQVKGALSRQEAQYDAAAQEKANRINQAMSILQAAGQDQHNIPMRAWLANIGGPRQTPWASESYTSAMNAETQALQQRQQQQRGDALALGRLGIEGADVGLERARSGQTFLDKRLQMGRQAMSDAIQRQAYRDRTQQLDRAAQSRAAAQVDAAEARAGATVSAADIRANAQRDVAEINSGSRVKAAEISAQRGRFKFEMNTADGRAGMWTDTHTGEVKYGPPGAAKAGATSSGTMQLIEALRAEARSQGRELTYADALQITKRSPNTSDTANLRREALALTAAKADFDYFSDPEETLAKWRKQYGLGAPGAPAASAPGSAAPTAPTGAAAGTGPAGLASQQPPYTPSAQTPLKPGAKSLPQSVTALPKEAAAQLKEGVQTKFGNGQTWTLKSGKPVRLK